MRRSKFDEWFDQRIHLDPDTPVELIKRMMKLAWQVATDVERRRAAPRIRQLKAMLRSADCPRDHRLMGVTGGEGSVECPWCKERKEATK